jgi:hypothetical protein
MYNNPKKGILRPARVKIVASRTGGVRAKREMLKRFSYFRSALVAVLTINPIRLNKSIWVSLVTI